MALARRIERRRPLLKFDWWVLRGEVCFWICIPVNRSCSRQYRRAQCQGLWRALAPGSGAKGVFVRATLRKCDRLQLLVNSEDLKLKNGNFKQKWGGHPGSLSLDYAIIFWVQVRWKILHIFFDTLGKVKWHLCSLPDLRSSVFHGKSCTIFIPFFFWDTFLPIGIFIFQVFCWRSCNFSCYLEICSTWTACHTTPLLRFEALGQIAVIS